MTSRIEGPAEEGVHCWDGRINCLRDQVLTAEIARLRQRLEEVGHDVKSSQVIIQNLSDAAATSIANAEALASSAASLKALSQQLDEAREANRAAFDWLARCALHPAWCEFRAAQLPADCTCGLNDVYHALCQAAPTLSAAPVARREG